MTDKTATQNLTRTQAGDDPRQMATYLQTLATEADQRMTAHLRDLARALDPPMAVLRLNVPIQLDANVTLPGSPYQGGVPFDTVDLDTGGMVDLSASQFTITLTEPGWWHVGGYALLNGFSPGSSSSDVMANIRANFSTFSDPRHDGQYGFFGSGSSGVTQVLSVAGAGPVAMVVTWSGASSTSVTTIQYAELWAVKDRDL